MPQPVVRARSFGPGTVSRDALWSLTYTAATRVGTAAISVVVARQLGAPGAGALGIALQLSAFAGLLATLNLPQGLARQLATTTDPRVHARLMAVSGALVLGLAALIGTAVALAAPWLAGSTFHDARLAPVLVACAPFILGMAGYNWVECALQGLRRFGAMTRWGVAVAVFDLALVFPAAQLGVAGVMVARAGVRLAAMLVGALAWLRPAREQAPAGGPPPAEGVVRALMGFSAATLVSSVATMAGQLLLRTMLVRSAGLGAAGHLQAADSLAQGLLLVPLAAMAAMMPAVTRDHARGEGGFAGLFERGMWQVTGLHLGVSLAAMAIVPWLLVAVFGRDFQEARPAFVLLAAAYGIGGPCMVFGTAMIGRGELWIGAAVNAAWSLVTLAAFRAFTAPLEAVGAALAMAIGFLALLAICTGFLLPRWGVPLRRVAAPVLGTPLATAAAVALSLTPGVPPPVAVGGCLAIAAGVFAAWTLRRLGSAARP